MEYVQITLDDWAEMKQKLRRELLGVRQSFVRIGFALRKIEEEKLYERDGYKSIAEFAKAECGLGATAVTRFIKINEEYSVDGYSEILAEEYEQFNRSLLEEMLKLADSDREMIRPEMDRESVRELKRFNNSKPEEGGRKVKDFIEAFYKGNKEMLDEIYTTGALSNTGEFVDIVNPSGNKTFRKGIYIMMMYENDIKIKEFGKEPHSMSWETFGEITKELFQEAADGRNTYRNYFGEEMEPQNAPKNQKDQEEKEPLKEKEVDTEGKTEEKVVAPAQKNAEIRNAEGLEEEKNIPRQMDITKDFPEYCPPDMNLPEPPQAIAVEAAPREEETRQQEEEEDGQSDHKEIVEEKPAYGSRKQYLDTMTAYGAALYMAASMKVMKHTLLNDVAYWETWLKTEVDENGEEIEVVE